MRGRGGGMAMAAAAAILFCFSGAQQVKSLRREDEAEQPARTSASSPLPLLGVRNHTQPPSWLLKLPSELRGGEMKLSLRKMRRVGSESTRKVSLLERSSTSGNDLAALATTTHREQSDAMSSSREGSALPPVERDWHKKMRAAWNSMLTNARVGLLAQGKLLVEPQLKGPASDLMSAALAGNPSLLTEELRKEHASVNIHNEMGETPLMLAAISGNTTALALLLARGAQLDAKDMHGWTALMKAVALGDTEMVKFLLEAGADAKAENNAGQSAMSIAKMWGKKKAAQLLIDAAPAAAGADGPSSSYSHPARQDAGTRGNVGRQAVQTSARSKQARSMKGAVIRACADTISEVDELKGMIENMEAKMKKSDEMWMETLKRKTENQMEQYRMIKSLEQEIQMSRLQVESLEGKLEAIEVSRQLNEVKDQLQGTAAGLSTMSKTLESTLQMLVRKLGLDEPALATLSHPVPATKFEYKKEDEVGGKCPRWQNQIEATPAQECRASVSLPDGSEDVRTSSTCGGLEVVSVESSRASSAQQQGQRADAEQPLKPISLEGPESPQQPFPPKIALREERLKLRENGAEGTFNLRTADASSSSVYGEEKGHDEESSGQQSVAILLSVWTSFLKSEVSKQAGQVLRGLVRTFARVAHFLRSYDWHEVRRGSLWAGVVTQGSVGAFSFGPTSTAENLQRQHDGEEERDDIDVDDDSQLRGQEPHDSSDASFDEVQEKDIVMQEESSVEGMDTAIEEDHDAQNQVDAAAVDKNASKRSSRRANGNGGKERKAPYHIRKSDIPLYSVDETGSLEELSLRSRSSLSPESSFDMGYAEPQLAQQPTMTVRPWMDDPAMGGFNPLPQRKALHQTPCKRLARSKLPFANMPDRMDQALIMIQNDINYLKKGNFAGSKLMQLSGSPHERKKTLLKQRSRSTEPVLVGRMHKSLSDQVPDWAEGEGRSHHTAMIQR
ncbi:hypothetical protein GUITHDRAFT_143506 [Guillardia theta CCMP2712]|uniref:Uncharacterized protein n=1 Tax=Guillardia theta (strain CCMP2712) TaxID=905079 RepID=L1ITT3_GUITC|nr:hypothetical protein GUITHDRAFT_143506 [Guillardia theta CCMP2712]EKX39522.1 hypothetical protein GUITHDRAFT_143506 [Guillardia theta CCMP2712]|eukprot:XP_005826502.1 hypothetical protein GUITHDRAFT_143506 [Guillardia theta CCMP2712]